MEPVNWWCTYYSKPPKFKLFVSACLTTFLENFMSFFCVEKKKGFLLGANQRSESKYDSAISVVAEL
jgi:hypothetical protein